ncbi:hypothetical protein NIES267_61180 [Calothrix parasitica NIES-267]|uniref:DUF6745 domain-containing protein n=1 Tax=Calothrix parasitica NIES-267 TaxID=1973488 RepID=A0A1Z4LZS0_9CYAN|nr:hypothetical protein NIES267_61180 [Calothrix parasitica NIES-267]
MIEKLTPEQEALIPIIRDEWIKIALDTSPTNKQKAEAAIKLAYQGCKPPKEILWFDNPLSAVIWIASNRKSLGDFFQSNFVPDEVSPCIQENIIDAAINSRVSCKVKQLIYVDVLDDIYCVLSNLRQILSDAIDDCFPYDIYEKDNYKDEDFEFIEDAIYNCPQGIWQIHELAYYAYFNAIGIDFPQLIAWWSTARECGCWWCFENFAVVTPKPSEINLDEDYQLHAEGKPAVNYDGFKIYANHGTIIPKKYGQIHPSKWKAEWLLSEKNAELRRILIQEIGYYRICQELQAVELDKWQEYTLLKINQNIDIESIHLLTMICPSTDNIHILRVPPDITSAREAMAWINWGIHPEEFAAQT